MELGLDGKRTYVMAASSGLGRAVAEQLVDEGAHVVVSSRDETRLRAAAETIRDATNCEDDAIDWVVCDLTDEESVRNATETAIDRLGGLDILVTNHGGPSTAPFSETSLSAFDEAYHGVLRSTFLTCEIALPALRDGGGAITNLVAASALEPSANGALGNVFRPGIYGLSKVLAEEFGADGVRVNCVSPRGVMSDRIRYKISELADREGISVAAARERRTDELPVSTSAHRSRSRAPSPTSPRPPRRTSPGQPFRSMAGGTDTPSEAIAGIEVVAVTNGTRPASGRFDAVTNVSCSTPNRG